MSRVGYAAAAALMAAVLVDKVTLTFDGELSGGFASCNHYGAESDLDDVRHVERDGDRLTLTGDSVTLEFAKAPPSS